MSWMGSDQASRSARSEIAAIADAVAGAGAVTGAAFAFHSTGNRSTEGRSTRIIQLDPSSDLHDTGHEGEIKRETHPHRFQCSADF
jgi:hypothetical protein